MDDRGAVSEAFEREVRELRARAAIVEASYRDLYERIPDMFVSVDVTSGQVVDCNRALMEALGRERPDLIGAPVGTLFHPTCRDVVHRALMRPNGETEIDTDIQLQTADGRWIDVDARIAAIRCGAGPVVAAQCFLRDVTRRKRTEEALRASQARYENLYSDAPDMFASVDVESGRVVQCNRTLVRTTGSTRAQVMGRRLHDLHDEACWPALIAALEQVQAQGHVRDVELRLCASDGAALDVSLSMVATRDEEDNVYFRCTWRDITERRRAQLALRQKQLELEGSRHTLQALTARLMTAQEDERRRISRELHDDVNQRLALLVMQIEKLERDVPAAPEELRSRLLVLRDRVVELSDDVHGLAYQFHPSILDDLGLAAAVESLIDEMSRRDGIAIELEQSIPDVVPPDVASCLYRVTQESLRNIVSHARASRGSVSLRSSDGGIQLVVRDMGVGFDPDDRTRDRPGLGVAGMRERVRLVGGRFSMTSSVGEGTCVDAWVPIREERA